MRTHMTCHFFHLTDRFAQLLAAQASKQREISLHHHSQMVADIIDLLLHRALSYAQKVHVAQFCQQNIIHQLVKVAVHHILLFEPHSIGAPQTSRLTLRKTSLCGPDILSA